MKTPRWFAAMTGGCAMALMAAGCALLLSACTSNEQRDDGECGSQKFAALALGDALADLRASKVYATTPQRREALAELEGAMVALIHQEPDSNFRGAAWNIADAKHRIERENDKVARREALLHRYNVDPRKNALHQEFLEASYREILGRVVANTDPRTPPRCYSDRWTPIHQQALRAQAY